MKVPNKKLYYDTGEIKAIGNFEKRNQAKLWVVYDKKEKVKEIFYYYKNRLIYQYKVQKHLDDIKKSSYDESDYFHGEKLFD